MQKTRILAPLLGLTILAACADDPTASRPLPPTTPEAPRAVGMVEITLTGIGTPQMSAVATQVGGADGARMALSPVPGGTPAGSIQLRRVSATTVDAGVRGAGGERYLQAVFEVRNADASGTPYNTPRPNLTFVPVGTASTIAGTPVGRFLKQDASAADPSVAVQLKPTGAVALGGGGGLVSQYPDVLQAFSEAETSAFTMPAAVTNAFPYGFVVRHASDGSSRTLAASPGADQYDGRVTFAYRLPLAANPADDPFSISVIAVAMDDGETRVTQSFEEQNAAGQSAFEARAQALGATRVTLFGGGAYTGPAPVSTICSMRSAGTAGSPMASIATTAPCLSEVAPDPMVPGATATLKGLNLGTAPTVTIGGKAAVVGTVTGGSQVTVTVPCVSSGPVAVQATAGSTASNAVFAPLQVRTHTLAVGQYAVLANAGEAECNEIAATGDSARYVMTVYNTSTASSSNAPFVVSTDEAAAQPAVRAAMSAAAEVSPSLFSAAARAEQRQEEEHIDLMEANRLEYERLSARFASHPRMRANRSAAAVAAPVEPPLTRKIRIARIDGSNFCRNYTEVNANRVFYDGKVAIYEDADSTPVALRAANSAKMQDYYNRIGQQFNADMEPVIRDNFGDVLARDAVTDNNGVMVAIFTPVINRRSPGVAGFVVSCDLFPNDSSATTPTNSSSNFGEVFYAYQPTDSVSAGGYSTFTPDSWYWSIRATFIHETKHVASYVSRVMKNAPLESSWLEEGTARHSEELWARNSIYNVAWKANTGYGSAAAPGSIYCDWRREASVAGGAECLATNPRRPSLNVYRHVQGLYNFMVNGRFYSLFGPTPDDGSNFYATSWSMVRFAIDRYGASDAAFLGALTQSTTTSTTNLSGVAGVPIARLMGEWSLGLALDDYPGMTPLSDTPRMPTWNLRDIYAGMNADPLLSFGRQWPVTYTQTFNFGSIAPVNVPTLRGGGVSWFMFTGLQTAPQLIKLGGGSVATPAALPSTIRMAIARVR
jgi:hypothetical protein